MTGFLLSELCASHRGENDFFAKFATLAVRFEGVENVMLLATGERPPVARPGKIFASAPIRYLDQIVGELHMFFNVQSFRESSPLPLVKLLAKQVEMAIQAAAVHASHGILQEYRAGLEAEIHEHKLLERARGVIESRRLIPPGEGKRLMQKVSDKSGKTLRDVARGIVTSANRNPWKFRREFWA
jgi:hypothetical protein